MTQRLVAIAFAATLTAGCGLLPGGGEDSTQSLPPAQATEAVEAPPTTTPSPLLNAAQAVLSAASSVLPDSEQADFADADSEAAPDDQAPSRPLLEVADDTGEPAPGSEESDPALDTASQATAEQLRDPTACRHADYGAWTVTRIRDGSCVGFVAENPGTVVGLVCRWTGQRQHAMDVFVILPPLAEDDEIVDLRLRYWVLPLQVFGPDGGPDDESAGWLAWTEFARQPMPWTEAEEGLLLSNLALADTSDAAAAPLRESEAQHQSDTALSQSAAESPGEAEDDGDAEAEAERDPSSSERHPTRVAFAPDNFIDEFIDEPTSILARFGDENAVRYGRPFELWLEAKFTVLPESEEESDDSEPEPELLDPIRVIFPLTGAAQALRVAADDCERLNRNAAFDGETSSHLLDGFALESSDS